jgi:hypothetical protein
MTLVLVTHDVAAGAPRCARQVAMRSGRIEASTGKALRASSSLSTDVRSASETEGV